jgi:hypothetical protein
MFTAYEYIEAMFLKQYEKDYPNLRNDYKLRREIMNKVLESLDDFQRDLFMKVSMPTYLKRHFLRWTHICICESNVIKFKPAFDASTWSISVGVLFVSAIPKPRLDSGRNLMFLRCILLDTVFQYLV